MGIVNPVKRHDLFRVLPPEAVPNSVTNGRTSLIAHKAICRVCKGVVASQHTTPGDGLKDHIHLEMLQLAANTETCDICGSVNLSAIVAEPESASAAQLS